MKLDVFGVFFLDGRGKNAQALLDLNITRLERMAVVRSIEVEAEHPMRYPLKGKED